MNFGFSSRRAAGRCAPRVALALISGCHMAPSVNILGSFFPPWLISIVTGIVLTVLARRILIATGIDASIRPASVVYPSLACLLIFATWLVLFGV
jgi:hypothetical protein